MAEKQRKDDETEHKEPTVLPAREAMSIISPGAAMPFVPDLSAVPDAGEATQSAVSDAQASASGEESVTSEDRSERFESHDSASSET
jgi:hypothetical protein